jgi:transcriptional regulator GlxA family with amidase domain
MLGLNRNKLQRGFRQIYGDTVFGFLREMRMHAARGTLLMARSMSVESVAALWGIQA